MGLASPLNMVDTDLLTISFTESAATNLKLTLSKYSKQVSYE
jgi:hypothetical protein